MQFAIDNAALAVKRCDQTHVTGCVYRSLCCMAQVLFALNDRYLIHEKGALGEAAAFAVTLAGLEAAVASIWAAIGRSEFTRALTGPSKLAENLRDLVDLKAA